LLSALLSCVLVACEQRGEHDAQQSGNNGAPTPSDSASMDGATTRTNPDTAAQSQIDDSAITARARTVLQADSSLHGADISIVTRGGTVTLAGTVDERRQKEAAEHLVRGLRGVRTVNNEINVKRFNVKR
jgi:osmotically-inducible protein OsmY